MNRSDFQELAELHLQHARALLDAKLYSGAYYMCGYAVECGLKACICRKINESDFPLSPEDSRKAWSHELKHLIVLANLSDKIRAERRADSILDVYWTVVEGWSVESRYYSWLQTEARIYIPRFRIRSIEFSHV